jgi:hypothetical protein
MLYRRVRSFAVTAAILLLAAGITVSAQESAHRGRKYKPPPPTSRIEVTILRSINGKPIENASVIFKLKGDKGNMELKTNEDGKAVIDVLPINSDVELQVIAKGFQTYGDDYKVDKDQMAIEIKMNRPGEQYSLYKQHDQKADAGKSPDKDKTGDANKNAAPKDAAKDKPAESAKQNDAQHGAGQPQPQ